jgi:nicotinate-nucleotide pyrophosphorylase (carboxylating)
MAVFASDHRSRGRIVAKAPLVAAGLPVIALVFEEADTGQAAGLDIRTAEGAFCKPGHVLAVVEAPTTLLLKCERIFLNFICHMSGVASLTRRYVERLEGTRTRLLDTRKTLPGLRYAEKYAVLAGGGCNHRMNLVEMLMLKDNHVDAAGGIGPALQRLREAYSPCPPVEVECRTLDEVRQAVAGRADRIMLDNMDHDTIARALELVPDSIETEISGSVNLDTIADLARLGPDFVSVGRLTHSAPAADISLQFEPQGI